MREDNYIFIDFPHLCTQDKNISKENNLTSQQINFDISIIRKDTLKLYHCTSSINQVDIGNNMGNINFNRKKKNPKLDLVKDRNKDLALNCKREKS